MIISPHHIRYAGVLVVFTLLGFGTAFGGTVEGRVQGLQCVISGKLCPIDDQDPHIAVEKHFIVYTSNNVYYFIPNLDRAVLARYLMKKVRVTGVKSERYNSIKADKFEVYRGGKWKTVWTQEMEDAEREAELGGG